MKSNRSLEARRKNLARIQAKNSKPPEKSLLTAETSKEEWSNRRVHDVNYPRNSISSESSMMSSSYSSSGAGTSHSSASGPSKGKVRLMFEEAERGRKYKMKTHAGRDRSYPLEPVISPKQSAVPKSRGDAHNRNMGQRNGISLDRIDQRRQNHNPGQHRTQSQPGRLNNGNKQNNRTPNRNTYQSNSKLKQPKENFNRRNINNNSKDNDVQPNTSDFKKSSSVDFPVEDQPADNKFLQACNNCGRSFAQDRINKHAQICKKVSNTKRKKFDMVKARVTGTDAQVFVKNTANFNKHKPKNTGGKKQDWRKKREDFISAIRNAKMAQKHIAKGGKASDIPAPPPADTSDYIQCPYCQRRFSEAAAHRHIPKCQNIKSNKRK